MNLSMLFQTDEWYNLTLALLHTLWEGAIVVALVAGALRFIPVQRTTTRYLTALSGLGLLVIFGFLTWAVLDHRNVPAVPSPSVDVARTPLTAISEQPQAESPRPSSSPQIPALPSQPDLNSQALSWVLLAWLLGVALMLVRLAVSLYDLRALARRATQPQNHTIQQAWNQVSRATQGKPRPIRLLVADQLAGPVTFGILWPTIVLPTALACQASPQLIHAILAHELAHIRRHDYLVNLGQILIESLLFFNPAVWWLNAQIRREREAACDAQAAHETGNETTYAEALADYATQLANPIPAMAMPFSRERGGDSLVDRVRRLLVPGYQPRLKLPISAVTTFLIVSAIVLIGLRQTSRIAVAVGAEWLTPKERIAKIRDIQSTHSIPLEEELFDEDRARSPRAKIPIEATIQTADGSPLQHEKLSAYGLSDRPRSSMHSTLSVRDGRITDELPAGMITLCVTSPNYAPTFYGPIRANMGSSLEDLEFVMTTGFEGKVQFQDEQGHPLPEVHVTGYYESGVSAPAGERTSDVDGIATFEHASDHPLRLRVRLAGYEQDERKLELNPDSPVTWKLKSAQPTTITLRSSKGDLIQNAEAKLFQRSGFQDRTWSGGAPIPYAQANEKGQLIFTELRSDSLYTFLVHAPGHGKLLLEDIAPNDPDREVTLAPATGIRGIVTGDLTRLRQRSFQSEDGQKERHPMVRYSNVLRFERGNYTDSNSGYAKVSIEDGIGTFEVADLWPGELLLTAGSEQTTHHLEIGIHDVHLQLADPETNTTPQSAVSEAPAIPNRTIVFHFKTPEGHPAANGTLRVVVNAKQPNGKTKYQEHSGHVVDGRLELAVPAGSRLSFEPSRFTGYWFQEVNENDIPEGSEALERTISCYPAGAIYGTISEIDGSPASAIMISVIEALRSPDRPNHSLDVNVKNSTSSSELTTTFAATPLPIGGRYRIVAHRGGTYAVSDELTISAEAPIHEIQLVMRPGITLTGTVTSPTGTPLSGIRFRHHYSPVPNHGFGSSELRTDRLGRFTVPDVVPDLPGTYSLEFRDNPGHQPLRLETKPEKSPLRVVLQPGNHVRGRVLDAKTGWPIPKAEVYAMPTPYAVNERYGYVEADSRTDENGYFEFSTLDREGYDIRVRSAENSKKPKVTPTQTPGDEIELRVTLSKWASIKPVRPKTTEAAPTEEP